MSQVKASKNTVFCPFLTDRIKLKQEQLFSWLSKMEKDLELPLYSSVDIRDAGFKVAVVDTNLFPAGFNNLCEHGLEDSEKFIRKAIVARVPRCEEILIIAEEHTRNTWYLENIRILEKIIRKAGFWVRTATFLEVQPEFCQDVNFIELETATGKTVKIHCLKKMIEMFQSNDRRIDLIIMNNDLTRGIPEILKESSIPIYPSIQAGWHSRQKSYHFAHTQELVNEFAAILELDPWFFSALYSTVAHIDINQESDRKRLTDAASDLIARIETKYREHQVTEKPFVFIKADAGTYGMAVMPIEDPQEIMHLNRKGRNKLYRGKGSQVVERYLLQEGIPTIYNNDQEASEVCIYQVENNLIGGFYRSNSQKGSRENLNSKGMGFKKMCPHSRKYGDCGVHHDVNVFDVYRILARIAANAAHREIIELEAKAR